MPDHATASALRRDVQSPNDGCNHPEYCEQRDLPPCPDDSPYADPANLGSTTIAEAYPYTTLKTRRHKNPKHRSTSLPHPYLD